MPYERIILPINLSKTRDSVIEQSSAGHHDPSFHGNATLTVTDWRIGSGWGCTTDVSGAARAAARTDPPASFIGSPNPNPRYTGGPSGQTQARSHSAV